MINTNNSRKQIGIGAVLSYVSIGVNILAGLIYTPWMIRTIGKSDYSLFTLANSLITMFLVDFGLSAATARFVAIYKAEGDQEKVNNFLGMVYKLYFIVDTILFVVLTGIFLMLSRIYVSLTAEEIQKLKVVYLIAAGYSVISFPFVTLNGILSAYEKFIQIKLADLLYRFLVVGLMVASLLKGYGLYAIVIVNATAGLIVILYKLIVIHKMTPVRVNFRYNNKSLLKQIFNFSIWVTINTLTQRLIFNITPSILGIVSNSSEIAIFGIVTTIEGYVYILTSAINGMFLSKISQINLSENSNELLTTLMVKVGRFQFGLNALILGGFIVVGDHFIRLWMGSDYSKAYIGILLVLIPGLFFNSLQIANTTIIVRGKVKMQAIVGLIVGIINVTVSFYISKSYGAVGACFSIFVAYTIRTILYILIDDRVLGFNMRRFFNDCYLKMFPPFVGIVLCGFVLNQLFITISWIEIVAKAVVLVLVYIISLTMFSLTRTERKIILDKIRCVTK